ncbi:hypothetical protein HAX54_018066 [Datura stramonium]|uniref:Uncharacterized protein n=1 Tax=Datura stramonium TaxID=4076 RepID=A0ABS8S145_DATST|nr:hypothetical protein [Datura stramonium]
MAASFYGMIEEVRVMLVDYERESAFKMVDLLKSYDYKVVTVHTASAAMSMLSKGKKKIDVMIISVRSPNLHSFQLLEQSVALDIISLFVCDEHYELLTKKALDEGAFLYLKKPLGAEIVKYLWQFVLTNKTQRKKVRDGSNEENREQGEEKNNVPNNTEEQSNNIEAENNVTLSGKRKRGGKSTKKINKGENQNSVINKVVRQKDCIKWTEDLHAKFVEVVQQLDDGSCFPKKILEGMNVLGLTKMQVASHLRI